MASPSDLYSQTVELPQSIIGAHLVMVPEVGEVMTTWGTTGLESFSTEVPEMKEPLPRALKMSVLRE